MWVRKCIFFIFFYGHLCSVSNSSGTLCANLEYPALNICEHSTLFLCFLLTPALEALHPLVKSLLGITLPFQGKVEHTACHLSLGHSTGVFTL